MITLELTHEEMEGLQSLCATADLVRIRESHMSGVAHVMKKIYEWEDVEKTFRKKGNDDG